MIRATANPRNSASSDSSCCCCSPPMLYVRSGCAAVRSARIEPARMSLASSPEITEASTVRSYRDDPLTILPQDGRRRHARVQGGHTHDRDLAPARRADQGVPFDVGDGIPLVCGQAHVDPDLFPAALHPDRLRAEERGASLPGKLLEGETEGSRFRQQLELNFRDARGVVRTYVVDASNSAETVDHRVCDPGEKLRMRMRQHRLDRVPQVDDLAAEGDSAHVRQHTHLLPPCLHEVHGGDLSLLRPQELELDGGDIGFRIEGRLRIEPPALDPRPLPDDHHYPVQQRRRALGPAARNPLDDPVACSLQLLRHLVGPRRGRPVGHLQGDRCVIPPRRRRPVW